MRSIYRKKFIIPDSTKLGLLHFMYANNLMQSEVLKGLMMTRPNWAVWKRQFKDKQYPEDCEMQIDTEHKCCNDVNESSPEQIEEAHTSSDSASTDNDDIIKSLLDFLKGKTKTEEDDDMVDTAEACEIIGMTECALRVRVRDGLLTKTKVCGRNYYKRSELLKIKSFNRRKS